MLKLENRTLGMEIAGFDPLDTFSPEQVVKMRSMKPRDNLGELQTTVSMNINTSDDLKEAWKRSNIKLKREYTDIVIQLGIKTYEKILQK